MSQFMANLKNELFKFSRRKKYLVFFILSCASCFICVLQGLVTQRLSGYHLSPEVLFRGLIYNNLPVLLLGFLPFIGILASSDLFVGERGDHTLRFSLMRPIGKGAWYFSKAVAVMILCVIYLAAGVVISLAAQLILGGGVQGTGSGLLAAVLDLVPMMVLILFFCLINQFIQSSGLAVLLCLVVYIGLIVMGTYVPSAGGLVFTGYLQWHNLWIGMTLPLFSLLPRIGILAGYGLIFACGGYLLFDHQIS